MAAEKQHAMQELPIERLNTKTPATETCYEGFYEL
ncbi:hypothetical protein L1277_000584 [Okibacterium sp. HSC-33S16]|nr:hypothetical protein [Okibacterium sp. HSC-33S16]